MNDHVTLRTCKDGILNDDFGTQDYYLVQQENCAKSTPKGLSAAIRKKYPYGCILHLPPSQRLPGEIMVRTPGTGGPQGPAPVGPVVVNFLAQRFPGKPGSGMGFISDSCSYRQRYFQFCLDKLGALNLDSSKNVVFPENIGCGLAGGNWKIYREMITKWAAKQKCHVWIVKMRV
jgi:hypothetical protein